MAITQSRPVHRTKSRRLNARMDSATSAILAQGAGLTGETLTQFVLGAATKEAQRLIVASQDPLAALVASGKARPPIRRQPGRQRRVIDTSADLSAALLAERARR
jgi:hypothetical protein